MENKSFWKTQVIYLIGILVFIGLVAAVTVLYDIPMEYSFYIIAFYFIFGVIGMFVQWLQYREQCREKRQEENRQYELKKQWEQLQEKEDFFELWTHQIKTPIAALNVLLQAPQIDEVKCRQEVFQIENYVEMALNYIRFEKMGNDFILEPQNLLSMVNAVVKKYASIFIHKHISVQLKELDHMILTDEKWFSFLLEQILSNALKYTKQGFITIYTEKCSEGLKVIVKDTGIGIRTEDIPRLFEKGFTGYNGRIDKKASGLGLYLSKGICDKLGHQISIVSEINQGTSVTIFVKTEELERADLTKM